VWEPGSIQSLPDLLEKAREVGRTVLLAADHGHVPSGRFETVERTTPGGTRWREWRAPDELLAEHELGFRGDGVFIPRGAHGVVLLTDDAHRFASGHHAGEHGGATLAEVIAPCLLIGAADNAGEASLRGVTAAHQPGWWLFDVRAPVAIEPEEPVRRKPRPKKVSDAQLALPVGSAPAAPAPGLAGALTGNALLKARARSDSQLKQVVAAVDFLLAQNGVASVHAFAAAMGEIAFRVSGLVSQLSEVLNVEGYDVLSYDRAGQQVRLNKGQLELLFEVKL
jgi:hypothetical protein